MVGNLDKYELDIEQFNNQFLELQAIPTPEEFTEKLILRNE